MCFLRIDTKHQPLKPPGAGPTLTTIYDRPFLDTSVDIADTANPTTKEIVASLNVNEKLQEANGKEMQPIRRVSVEAVVEKNGKRRESMPKNTKRARRSRCGEKTQILSKAGNEAEAERQRSLELLENLEAGNETRFCTIASNTLHQHRADKAP